MKTTPNKVINVLHITFDMGIGGTEQVIKNLIEGSRELPIEHHICCLEGPVGPWGIALEQDGIPVFKLQRAPKITWAIVSELRKIIKDNNIDIVHGHQYTPFVFGFLATRLTKVKILFTEHGRFYPDIVSKKRQLFNRLIFLFVDGVTAISKATKQALVDHEKIPKIKIDVIYNGILPVPETPKEKLDELRTSLNIPSDATIFGTIARLDPIKNQTMMIEGFAQAYAENPNIRLIIVGDGPERKNLETLITTLELQHVVTLTGFIPAPKDYINLFDVFLLTSLSEGTSMTLLEAMSAGKPSIVTDVGGNPELINNKALGLVIEQNSNELKVAILTLTKEIQLASTTNDITELFNKRFGAATMVNSFKTYYEAVIRQKGIQ